MRISSMKTRKALADVIVALMGLLQKYQDCDMSDDAHNDLEKVLQVALRGLIGEPEAQRQGGRND